MMGLGDNGWFWVLLGLAAVLSGKRSALPWGDGWMWPVPPARYPDGVTYAPVISQEYRQASHAGVDIMYRRRTTQDRPEVPPGPDGTPRYFAPPGTPVVAARDGIVWSVDRSPRGWQVVIDHGKPWATYYQHLASVKLAPHAAGKPTAGGPPTVIRAGEQIGNMGGDPLDAPQHLRHLHFAVWFNGAGDAASVDPAGAMASWSHAAPWEVV